MCLAQVREMVIIVESSPSRIFGSFVMVNKKGGTFSSKLQSNLLNSEPSGLYVFISNYQ